MAKLERGSLSKLSCPRDKTTYCPLLADSSISLFVSVHSGPQTTVVIISIFSFPCSSSVETLAPALVPVAVDQQANDNEEDTTQHGEENSEENS